MTNLKDIVKSALAEEAAKSKDTLYHIKNGIRIESIHSRIKGDFSKIYGDCSNIKGKVSKIYGDCSNIKGNVSNIKGDVSNLKGDVSNIKGDVSNIKGNVSYFKGNVSDIQGRVSKLKSIEKASTETATKSKVPGDTSKKVLKPLKLTKQEKLLLFAIQYKGWHTCSKEDIPTMTILAEKGFLMTKFYDKALPQFKLNT